MQQQQHQQRSVTTNANEISESDKKVTNISKVLAVASNYFHVASSAGEQFSRDPKKREETEEAVGKGRGIQSLLRQHCCGNLIVIARAKYFIAAHTFFHFSLIFLFFDTLICHVTLSPIMSHFNLLAVK